MSLRARLLVSILVLVSGALVIAAIATYAEERSYLYGRLDQRAIAASAPIAYALGLDARLLARPKPTEDEHVGVGHPGRSPLGGGLAGFVPSGTFGELVGQRGKVLRGPIMASYGERPLPRPVLPRHLAIAAPGSSPNLVTVGSTPHSNVRYRLAALGLESGAGTIVVAVPLRDVEQTLDRLVLDEVLVVVTIIVLIVGIGWFVIKVALRPLDRMGRTASEISDGDLSRRVSPATTRTEIGRLGLSLNRMLRRIEDAFSDRARSEERRRQFLSDASHELRTPLASIRGYAELFRLGAARDPAALERAMERIEAEATRMGILVDELLLLARLDELPEAQREPVDLSELAARAVADTQAMAPERTLSLHSQESVVVLGEAHALSQVLTNLLVNAVIHTPPEGGVELSVRRAGGEAIVEVRDHGPGLPVGAEEQVFERFWRADGARTRGRGGGSGLGLSIVREIVGAHHGSVRAVNAPDGGAVFTVTLPAVPGGPKPVPAARERTGAAALG